MAPNLRRWILPVISSVMVLAAISVFAWSFLHPEQPHGFEVQGVDVSRYQGTIDWEVLGADLDFAFIKATEGSSWVDPEFHTNFANASNVQNLRVGAYHFFSFSSPGETQAEHFIATVGDTLDLPPVVDFEFYGDGQRQLDSTSVQHELLVLLDGLQEHFGVQPIIYTTYAAFNAHLIDFEFDYNLWIRSVYRKPADDDWTFWQYSSRGTLPGYDGAERFIDLNVFNGTKDEFAAFGRRVD